MKFSTLNYKKIDAGNSPSIPVGVVLQTPGNLLFKFDSSPEKFMKLRELNPEADKETFDNLSITFQQNFIDRETIPTSDSKGNRINININDPNFLPYLHESFQNYYQYSEPKEIQGDDPDKTLELLYSRLVLVE